MIRQFKNSYFKDFEITKTGDFFNNIKVVRNETVTFDNCYNHLLETLNTIDIKHCLPDKIDWDYERVGYDPLCFNDLFDTTMQGNDYDICGHVEQYYYYDRKDVIINNFLHISFTTSKNETFEICFAFFGATVSILSKVLDKAYYKFSVPKNHEELFELAINP